jgi:hypothetical protein
MSHRIFIYWKEISRWELCCKTTAQTRLKEYLAAFNKSETDELTIFEYAAIKNIATEELYIRLHIDYSNFKMHDIYALVEQLRKKLNVAGIQPKQKGMRTSIESDRSRMKKVHSK